MRNIFSIARDPRGANTAALAHPGTWIFLAAAILAIAVPALAEHTRWWRQATFEEFDKGTAKGVALRSDGKMFLAPRFAEFADANLAYLQAASSHDAPVNAAPDAGTNPVDGHDVPVPHFGVVLSLPAWEALAERVRSAGVVFGIEPHVRFTGEPGEQATMFFRDPSGNALEFKAFRDLGQLFAR